MPKIRIAGVIIPNDEKWIYDWFEEDSFCEADLNRAITNPLDDLEIEINSSGGSVYAASEIFTRLKNHQGRVTVTVTGLAASAASLIAMAGKPLRMSPTAQMMIHNASAIAAGDYRDMDKASDWLQKVNESVAAAYMGKTGKTKDEILDLMNQETWMTAEQAKEQGFADEVLYQESQLQIVACFSAPVIPAAVVKKLNQKRAQAQLDLLKLKGRTNA